MTNPEPSLYEIGVWQAIWRRLRPNMGAFLATDLLLGVVAAALSALWSDEPDRIASAIGAAVAAVLVVTVLVILWMWLTTPYQQRDAAVTAFRDHIEEEHPPGRLALVVKGPTPLKPWRPEPGAAKYLMAELSFALITNQTDRNWNLSMWLDGWVGERHLELDKDLWRWVWDHHPRTRDTYRSNPLEILSGDVIVGTIPFLMPMEADLVGQRLERPRLVARDNKVPRGQIVRMLPAVEDETINIEWAIGVSDSSDS